MNPQDRKREIAEDLTQTRRAMKVARKELAAQSRVWVIAGRMRLVSLATYVLSQGELKPVESYLRRQASRRSTWPDLSDADLKILILDLVAAATDAELMVLTEPESTPDAEALREAHALVVAWRARNWAEAQNFRGIAPLGAAILEERERLAAEVHATVRPRSWGVVSLALSPRSRKQLYNLRTDFGGYVGRLQIRADVSQETLVQKAMIEISFRMCRLSLV
jgi:hypothetical protein